MSTEDQLQQDRDKNIKKVTGRLVTLTLVMLAFAFALVPLYDVFCEVTGLNGKTSDEAATELKTEIDESRLVTVQFLATTAAGLPWRFKPKDKTMKVHPGKIYVTSYTALNQAPTAITGQAIPSVTPGLAAEHFNKTECFCFVQQTLKPNENREMPLRFMINPNLPKDIKEVTLSYTFYYQKKQDKS